MRSKNEARLKMYQSVADFLSKNTQLTQSLPEFAALSAILQENIGKLLEFMKVQTSDHNGITFAKKKEKSEVLNRTLSLSGKVTAYATLLGDELLLRTVKITSSTLSTKSDHQLAAFCLSLCDAATPLLPKLQDYSVTEEELNALKQLGSEFLSMIPKPREARRDSKQANHAMQLLMQETDSILQKMDALIQIIRYSNASFYQHFKDSRKIIEQGGRSQSARVLVKEISSNVGMAGVLVTFQHSNGSIGKIVYEKKTKGKGGFFIPSLDDGTYLVTASKEGYQPQTKTVFINQGELTRIELELIPARDLPG
ncbi:MAG: carboxypeptidase regulatory-like domain-containing protein [Bacteroidetes bacterium]|nr:carboxypeptidase regulatory-like domain-containing protein [Bacteroidota bacterium]